LKYESATYSEAVTQEVHQLLEEQFSTFFSFVFDYEMCQLEQMVAVLSVTFGFYRAI
jgi:hypothetical protein